METWDELLTVGEAAQRLRVSQTSIRVWLREGKLARTKVGRLIRIRSSEIERYLAAGNSKPVQTATAAEAGLAAAA